MLPEAEIFPVTDNVLGTIIFPVKLISPVTLKLVNAPTLVMFVCAAVVNVPVKLLAITFPVTL